MICEKRKRKQNILQHEANCSQIASCPLMQNETVQALAKIRCCRILALTKNLSWAKIRLYRILAKRRTDDELYQKRYRK